MRVPLFVHCSMGSLGAVPGGLAAQIAAVKQAAFDGVEAWVDPAGSVIAEVGRVAAGAGLRLGAAGYLPESAEPEPLFTHAKKARVRYLELQVDGYWETDGWVLERTRNLMALGQRYELPFYLETHRGRYTQDMRRTLWLLGELPELALCGDFSHYVCSSELKAPWNAGWKRGLYAIAARCGMIHARVNGGQRVQDPIASLPPGQAAEFLDAWMHAYHAASNAEVAAAESFTVTTELLPPDYQYVAAGEPVGNLWAESCWLAEMVRDRLLDRPPPDDPD